jgi:hypothetical protein
MVNQSKNAKYGSSKSLSEAASRSAISSFADRFVWGAIWLSIHVSKKKNGCIGATLWQIEKCIKKIVREAGKWHYLPTIAGNH